MKCLNCKEDLKPSFKDLPVILGERTVARYVICKHCKHVNQLIYYFSSIPMTYLDEEEVK